MAQVSNAIRLSKNDQQKVLAYAKAFLDLYRRARYDYQPPPSGIQLTEEQIEYIAYQSAIALTGLPYLSKDKPRWKSAYWLAYQFLQTA